MIVATEEGLAAVPRGMREASLALGATKLETILRVVLPAVIPSILTGLILAMARAAGEVAPLMLTGVVKLAPALPDRRLLAVLPSRPQVHAPRASTSTTWASSRPTWTRRGRWCSSRRCCCSLIVVLLNLFAIALAQPPAPEVRDLGGVAEDPMAG